MTSSLIVHIDDETLGALDRLAMRADSTRDALLTEAVQEYVAVHHWQLAQIDEGIAAADRGDFATNDDIERIRQKFFLPG